MVFQKLLGLIVFASVDFDLQIRMNDIIDRHSYKCVDYLPYPLYAIRYTFMPLSTPPPPPVDNAATTAAGSTKGPSRAGLVGLGHIFRRASTDSPDVDSTRDTQYQRGSGTADTGIAARPVTQSADRSLDAARHKVTLAEKAEKEAEKEGGA